MRILPKYLLDFHALSTKIMVEGKIPKKEALRWQIG
jgi:hypothetical protein